MILWYKSYMTRINPEEVWLDDSTKSATPYKKFGAHKSEPMYSLTPSEIFARLRSGSVDIDRAIDVLNRENDCVSLLWAGELAVEKALSLEDMESIANTIGLAKSLFAKSQRAGALRNGREIDHNIARAKIFDSNLPVYASLLAGGVAPSQVVAEKIYKKNLDIGAELVQRYRTLGNREPVTKKISGFIGKIAIQSLLQRDALISRTTAKGFPTIALISVSTLNKNRTNLHEVWDIETLRSSTSGARRFVERDLKLGVHTIPSPEFDSTLAGQKVPHVNINPDLKLASDRSYNVTTQIIEDCWHELNVSNVPNSKIARLDTMTTLLHQIIEQEAA
jgi:hypothetical protein